MQQPTGPVEPASAPAVAPVTTNVPDSVGASQIPGATAQTSTTMTPAIHPHQEAPAMAAHVASHIAQSAAVNGQLTSISLSGASELLRGGPGVPARNAEPKQMGNLSKEGSPQAAAQEINAANPLCGTASPVFPQALPSQQRSSVQMQFVSPQAMLAVNAVQSNQVQNLEANVASPQVHPMSQKATTPQPARKFLTSTPNPVATKLSATSSTSAPLISQIASPASIAGAPSSQVQSVVPPNPPVKPQAEASVETLTCSAKLQQPSIQSASMDLTNASSSLVASDVAASRMQMPANAALNAYQAAGANVPPRGTYSARPIAPRPTAGLTTSVSAESEPGRTTGVAAVAQRTDTLHRKNQKMVPSQKPERKLQILPTSAVISSKNGNSLSRSSGVNSKKKTAQSSGLSKRKGANTANSKKTMPVAPSLTSLLLKSLGGDKPKIGEGPVRSTSSNEQKSNATKVSVDNIGVLAQTGKESQQNTGATDADIRPLEENKEEMKVDTVRNASSANKRARSALETEESNNQDSSKNCTDTIRPAKRLASNKNTLNAPNRASSGVSPAGSKSSNAQSGAGAVQSSTEGSTSELPEIEKAKPSTSGATTTKPILRSVSTKSQTRQGASTTLGRPLLRSSPINTNVSKTGSGPTKMEETGANKDSGVCASKTGDTKARSTKSVSWAPDQQLAQVVEIFNRVELIKSWDPESEITLPFTAVTLANFRNRIATEEAQSNRPSNIANSIIASNEQDANDAFAPESQVRRTDAAHLDMDAERRHMEAYRIEQRNEEQRRRLDSMNETRAWPIIPIHIVLPPECVLEENVAGFSLCEAMATLEIEVDENRFTPPSPQEHSSAPRPPLAVDIPLHDTCGKELSDTSGMIVGSSGNEMRDGEIGGDLNRNNDNSYGSRQNAFHNNGGGGNHFRGQSQENNAVEDINGRNYGVRRDGGSNQENDPHHSGNLNHNGAVRGMGFVTGANADVRDRVMNGYGNFRGENAGPSHDRGGHSRGGQSGGNNIGGGMNMASPAQFTPVQLHKLVSVLNEHRGLPPPPPIPEGVPMPPFAPNGPQGGVPPPFFVHPPPPGMRMGELGRGMMMPMMPPPLPPPGLAAGMGMMGAAGSMGGGRMAGRAKSKKKCKYFGTKQGCRDGSSCNFNHDI